MEEVGTSFFHMVCGAVLFIAAMLCLVIGIRGVTASVELCRERLTDEVLYETGNQAEEVFVNGEYVAAYLMSEPQHAVCIVNTGSSYTLQNGSNMVRNLVSSGIAPGTLYRISYEYGMYGDIRQVCFTEVER